MSHRDDFRERRPFGAPGDSMHDDPHDDTRDGDAEEGEMDALDRLILGAAAEYHAPPAAPPREAMWEAILAARAGAAASPPSDAPVAAPAFTPAPDLRVVRTAAPAPRQAAPEQGAVRRWADRRWVGLAAAASLLLATGVGLGRWWGESRSASAARDAGVPTAPGAQVAATAGTPRSTGAATAPSPADRSAEGAATDATPDVTRDGSPDRGRTRGVDLGGGPAGVRLAESATASAEGTGTGDAAYDVASLQHFTAAEALLVSYRSARTQPTLSDSMSVALDGRLSTWARQLLQDTRLLLDSPAGTDPRRRQLLEDLELVLAQITRLGTAGGSNSPSAPAAGERAAIDGTLQRGQVLSRLRTAIPSGT